MEIVDILLRAIDRLIDLLKIREKRLQERFDQIWKPTYSDLQSVHSDYYSMFQTVNSFFAAASNDPIQQEDAYEKAISFLKEKRVAFAPVRQKLVALQEMTSDESFMKVLTDRESEFLFGVQKYMGRSSLPDRVESRSAGLQAELERMAAMDERVASAMLEDLDSRIEKLGEDWIHVSKLFNQLQIAIIQQST